MEKLVEDGHVAEDLPVDFGQNLCVGSEGWRNILATEEEADCALEESFEGWAFDEFGEAGHVCCGEDEHVSELSGRS